MNNESAKNILSSAVVMPVMVIEHLEDAVPLAQALVDGGIKVLEITLRSDVAMQAIEKIIAEVPDAIVGAGTVTSVDQLLQVEKLGVKFALSPGLTPSLLQAAKNMQLDFIPAVASASDVMLGMEYGYENFKLFPAQVLGGKDMLNALSGPFPDVRFCPTGGLNEKNFCEVLALKNVLCVGGSWLTPKELLAKKDWRSITELAKKTVSMVFKHKS